MQQFIWEPRCNADFFRCCRGDGPKFSWRKGPDRSESRVFFVRYIHTYIHTGCMVGTGWVGGWQVEDHTPRHLLTMTKFRPGLGLVPAWGILKNPEYSILIIRLQCLLRFLLIPVGHERKTPEGHDRDINDASRLQSPEALT